MYIYSLFDIYPTLRKRKILIKAGRSAGYMGDILMIGSKPTLTTWAEIGHIGSKISPTDHVPN